MRLKVLTSQEMSSFLGRLLEDNKVRAYDPCISCSTHLLDVKFV